MNHTHQKKLNYNKITPRVYIGTNACCQTHFHEKLIKKGINADISMEYEQMDHPKGINFFIWLPTRDHTPPTKEQLKFGVEAIDSLLKLKKHIYLHCKNGHGRAPTMFAAYLIWKKNMSVKDAISFIKKKRPSIHLEKNQLKALENFRKQTNNS